MKSLYLIYDESVDSLKIAGDLDLAKAAIMLVTLLTRANEAMANQLKELKESEAIKDGGQ